MILIESILSGIWATLLMDLLARFLSSRCLIYPFIIPEALGRWFLYLFKGKFKHGDINRTPVLVNEKTWYFLSHYLIGIVLAGIYFLFTYKQLENRDHAWLAPVYGMCTVCLPWFWLLPSIGLGVLARKSAKQMLILRTNFINHTNFGFGLFVWFILFHQLFSLAEATSGEVLLRQFHNSELDIIPVVRKAEIKYSRPAESAVSNIHCFMALVR